jgi:hypothetical protein
VPDRTKFLPLRRPAQDFIQILNCRFKKLRRSRDFLSGKKPGTAGRLTKYSPNGATAAKMPARREACWRRLQPVSATFRVEDGHTEPHMGSLTKKFPCVQSLLARSGCARGWATCRRNQPAVSGYRESQNSSTKGKSLGPGLVTRRCISGGGYQMPLVEEDLGGSVGP